MGNAQSRSGEPVGLFCGLAVLDVVQLVDEPPGPDEKTTALDQVVAAGGPATNAAVTFAALGGRALLAAPVGKGPLAALVRADLAAQGVELIDCTASASGSRPAASPTRPRDRRPVGGSGRAGGVGGGSAPAAGGAPGALSVSSCIVSAGTGQRSVVSTNARLPVDPAPLVGFGRAVAAGRAPAPDVVLVDGHNPALARVALNMAEATGARRVMDAGSWKDDAADLLGRCDVVAASARFRPPGAADRPDEVAAWLLGRGVPAVVITRGQQGALWWRAGATGSAGPADNAGDGAPTGSTGSTGAPVAHGSVEAPAVAVVDTLGAGDAFHGALAYVLATGAGGPAGGEAGEPCSYEPGPGARTAVENGEHVEDVESRARSGPKTVALGVALGAGALEAAVRRACRIAAVSTTTLGTRAWLDHVRTTTSA